MRHFIGLVALLEVFTACRGSASEGLPRVAPQPAPVAPSVVRNQDTLRVPETVFQEKRTLTLARMSILRSYLEDFVESRSSLPEGFEALRSFSDEGFDIASVDGWTRQMRYNAVGRNYTFRSAGADAEFGTPDDVIYAGRIGRSQPCFIIVGDGRQFSLGNDDPGCARP